MIGQIEKIINHPVRWATVISVLTGIYGQGTLLLSGVLVARILGVEDRGYLALLVVFPTLCSQLVGLGFPIAITYQISANPNQLPKILNLAGKTFAIQALVIVIVHGMIMWFFLGNYPDFPRVTGYLTLLAGPTMLAIQYGLAFFQGIGKFYHLNILRILLTTSYALMVLSLFLTETGDLHRVTMIWVIAAIFAGTVAFELVRRLKHPMTEKMALDNPPSQKEMLKFGLKGLLGSTSPMDTFRLDQLVAGLILSPIALGLYVVGGAFGTLARLIAQSASMVAYPTIANRQDREAAGRTMWRFFWAVSLVNGLLTIILIVSVPWLVPLFFGDAFNEAILLAQILLIGAALMASRRVLVECLRGLGQPQVSTFAEISMYPWLFTGGVFLLWNYGVQGLASGVAIGFGISLIVALGFALGQKRAAITFSPRSEVRNTLS